MLSWMGFGEENTNTIAMLRRRKGWGVSGIGTWEKLRRGTRLEIMKQLLSKLWTALTLCTCALPILLLDTPTRNVFFVFLSKKLHCGEYEKKNYIFYLFQNLCSYFSFKVKIYIINSQKKKIYIIRFVINIIFLYL